MNEIKKNCYFCGSSATTREHIPPKSLFLEAPTNLITVPSCDKHNTCKSGIDEYFRMMRWSACINDKSFPEKLREKKLRSVKRKPKLGMSIIKNVQQENGKFFIDTTDNRMQKELEAIARGVIYKKYDKQYEESLHPLIYANFIHISPINSEETQRRQSFISSLVKKTGIILNNLNFEGNNGDIFMN